MKFQDVRKMHPASKPKREMKLQKNEKFQFIGAKLARWIE
jgi:hypothetical protein